MRKIVWAFFVLLGALVLSGCVPDYPYRPNSPPHAAFDIALEGEVLTYRFDASPSYDPDGRIVLYRWDFIPPYETRYGQVVSYTFPNAGTYTVRLTVTDDLGATATAERTVFVDAWVLEQALIRNAMDYWHPITQTFTYENATPPTSPFSIVHICDLYDATYEDWHYAKIPGHIPASQVIGTGLRGDCSEFATTLCALLKVLGGHVRWVGVTNGQETHAYAEVYIGRWPQDAQAIANYIGARYLTSEIIWFIVEGRQAWLSLDWTTYHPGGRPYFDRRYLVVYPWPDGRYHPLTVEEEGVLLTGELRGLTPAR